MAKGLDQQIPDLTTSWEGYAGSRVEELIKAQLNEKIGAIHIDDSQDTLLTVRCFKTQADKTAWQLDTGNEELVLDTFNVNVASRNGEGTAYIVSLVAQDTSDAKFTNVKKLLIPLKFTCKKSATVAGTTTTEDMAGTSGTIIVTGRKANTSGNFTTLTASDGEARYIDAVAADSTNYKDFDLGPFLQDGEWNYRINVIEPEKQTVSTTVTVNVTLSESMGLEYAGDLGHPFEGDSVALPFYVKGSVDRKVHIEVMSADRKTILAQPEAKTFTSTQGGSETTQNITITKDQYKFSHGTYMIHAWMTFAADTSGTKIDEQYFGLMFKESDNETVLVAVSDILTEADNYDTVSLLKYAVYNPSGDTVDLTLSVVDALNGETTYYTESVTCENGETYTMRTALNFEHDPVDFSVLVYIKSGSTTYYQGTVYLYNDTDFSPVGTPNLELVPNTKTFYGVDTKGNSFEFDASALQLVNQSSTNETVLKNPSMEGFVRENDIDRFRLLKGSLLDLPFEPFITTTGLKISGVDYSMTMEFDLEINNIVDEDVDLIKCYTGSSDSFVGLRFTPNRVLVLGSGSGPISTPDMADCYLEEGQRMHIVINIVNNLRNEGLNYMRIFVDGVMQREYTYANTSTSPFTGATGTNGHLYIGSTGADLDIYGIRIMLDQALSSTDVQQDYKASMSSIVDKKAFLAANDEILSGGLIDYDKAKLLYNTILYELPSTASFPTFNNGHPSTANVKMTVKIIGDEKHSGVFSNVTIKSQGSTAMKYYWPNISSSLTKAEKASDGVAGSFTSDGIDPDTNLPYYNKTSYYQLDDDQPKAKKWVGKVNYASSMQSHKLGATSAYNDLHKQCAHPSGGFTYDKVNPSTPSRRAVKQKPFLCFYTDATHSTPTFCGFETWGAGKGDKPTFGYDDDSSKASYTPDYVMLEGADNNVSGANFETPWIPSEMLYDTSEESFCYNGAPNFDFDLGAVDDVEHPSDGALNTINDYFIPGFNMVYLLNPNLRPYNGNLTSLNQAYLRDKARQANTENTEDLELESNVHYWCCDTTNSEYLNVYRMDYVNDCWVNAGLSTLDTKHSTGYNNIITAVLNLKTQLSITDNDLAGMTNAEKNEALIQFRVEKFKEQFPVYFDKTDALFHQCFVKLFAGTDNRAKNTYYWIEGNIDHKIRFDQDDLDTILKTDNKGQQSKPYWILEDDKDEYDAWFWNGRDNALFRLIEMAYESDMRTMMYNIFAAMVSLCGTVDKFFQQYFFDVQEYFPAVAYNETARLLYETAQLYYDGIHPSESGKSYGYKEMPITQSLGNQLHAEREYIEKRLALIESYANFGDFSLNGSDSITFTSTGSSTYNIQWTAYQDIFPVAAFGQALDYGYDSDGVHHTAPWRLKAGETCTFIASGMSGETTVAIQGMSFCSNIGNLGANAIKGNLRITGKRLRELVMPRLTTAFQPSSINLASNLNLEKIDWRDIDFTSSTPTFDFSSMMSLQSCDLSGCTGVSGLTIPKTAALTTLKMPSGLLRMEIYDVPNLTTFSVDSVVNMNNCFVNQATAPGVDTLTLAGELKEQATGLLSCSMLNVKWEGVTVPQLLWFAEMAPYSYGTTSETYALTGKASVDQTLQRLTWAYKLTLVYAFGNIDATSDTPLSLTYDKVAANSIAMSGPTYIKETGQYQYSISVTPTTANNINIVTEADGSIHEDITFAFVDSNGAELQLSQYCNWEDAHQGILNVTKVTTEASGQRYTLQATVNTSSKTLTADMQVGFYQRVPKIGDFAYADGTFDDQYDKNKTLVGIVYKLNPMYQGTDDVEITTYGGYNKPTESVKASKTLVGYQILIDAKEDVVFKSTDGVINTTSERWGCYNSSDSNGFTTAHGTEMASATGLSSVFDLPSLVNVTSRGISGGDDNSCLITTNYMDEDQEDGFKDYSDQATSILVNNWQGKANTAAIVKHMNTIFNEYLLSESNDDVSLTWTDDDGVKHSIVELPKTVEELSNFMEILQYANGNLAKYRQFAYPAGYGCYLYEPTVKDGETLDSQYAAGNWYLPGGAEILRQYAFFAVSRTGGISETYSVGTSTSPSTAVIQTMIENAWKSSESNYINSNVLWSHIENQEYTSADIVAINKYFHALIEADKPIYSMLAWRAYVTAGASPFTHHTIGYRWCSTEYSTNGAWYINFSNGYSTGVGTYLKYATCGVRPAVAYSFVL